MSSCRRKNIFFKTNNYEVVCHCYQNKISEMHQTKTIMNNLQKNCQNVIHVTCGIAPHLNFLGPKGFCSHIRKQLLFHVE